MKMNGKWMGWMAATAFLVGGSVAFAQDKRPTDKPADKPAAKPADKPAAKPADHPKAGDHPKAVDKTPPAGDKGGQPDMAAMMEEMKKMSSPDKEHEMLKPLVGSFTCTTKMFTAPGAPPMESTGTVDRKWMLGNRYLAEEVKATMMGMPFEGFGVTGYDKLQKFYHSYWIDTFGTGTWTMTGTADASGKVITLVGENFDPMAMTKKKGRSTLEFVSNDKHTMKMYDVGPDGKETLGFEMTCTRK